MKEERKRSNYGTNKLKISWIFLELLAIKASKLESLLSPQLSITMTLNPSIWGIPSRRWVNGHFGQINFQSQFLFIYAISIEIKSLAGSIILIFYDVESYFASDDGFLNMKCQLESSWADDMRVKYSNR